MLDRERQFYVFGSLFDYCTVMCNDLIALPNCQIINDKTLLKSSLSRCVYKFHNHFKLPKREFWYKYLFDTTHVRNRGGTTILSSLILIRMFIIRIFYIG